MWSYYITRLLTRKFNKNLFGEHSLVTRLNHGKSHTNDVGSLNSMGQYIFYYF